MKGVLATFAIVAILAVLAATTANVTAKEPRVEIEKFMAVPYPQIVDIANDPIQAGVIVDYYGYDDKQIVLGNKNDFAVFIQAYNKDGVRSALIGPDGIFFGNAMDIESIMIAYPNQSYICRNPNPPNADWLYYFCNI